MQTRNLFLGVFFLLSAGGCLAQSAGTRDSQQWHWTGVERVVVVADVHGAYSEFSRLLKATGIVDDSLHWTGGKSHLVSVGDLLDRGAESRQVTDLLMRLQEESMATDGRVHVVAGNHELMNLIGDLRYVSKEEFQAFAPEESADERESAYQNFLNATDQAFASDEAGRRAFDERFPVGFFGHRAAFAADGHYGRWLLSLPAVIAINDIAYVHGGLPEFVADNDPAELNRLYRATVRRYLELWRDLIDAGILPDDQGKDASDLARSLLQNSDPSGCVEERQATCEQVLESGETPPDPETVGRLEEFVRLSDAPVLGVDGPLWYRGAIFCRDIFERPVLDAALKNLNVGKVVVGHTTTPDARVREIHDGKLTMLDTGMLVKYYSGRPAALIIENGTSVVQYLDPDERTGPLVTDRPEAYGLTADQLTKALESGTVTTVDKTSNDEPWPVQVAYKNKTIRALFYPRDRKRTDQAELAAFGLNRLLGFDLVPATVARELGGSEGALQLWYPDAITEQQRIEQGLNFGGWCSMNKQFQLMYAWDILTANGGRTAVNLLYRKRLWRLYLNQHGKAFRNDKKLSKSLRPDAVTLAPGVAAALSRLDEPSLQAELGLWLDDKKIKSLLSRRDAMLEYFNQPK